jgi:hypothetical protein
MTQVKIDVPTKKAVRTTRKPKTRGRRENDLPSVPLTIGNTSTSF